MSFSRDQKLRAAGLLFLGLIFVVPRLAFYGRPLVGEEGIFADLFVNHALDPGMGLMGRIHGEDYRLLLVHPFLLYKSLALLGGLLEGPWRFLLGEAWHPGWALRASFSLYQLLPWALLVAWLAPFLWARPWLWLLLAAAINAPLGLGGSIYLQTDSTNGALLAGLMGLALARRPTLLPWAALALGLAGKQEWSLGAAGGFFAATAWGGWRADEKRLLGLSLAALLLGNLGSWACRPEAYLGGLKLMLALGKSHNALSGSTRTLVGAMVFRAHFLVPLIALWLGLAALLRRPTDSGSLALRWSLAASLALSLPFMATAWGKDYRYFIPPFMLGAPPFFAALARAFADEAAWMAGRKAIVMACLALGLHALGFGADALARNYSVTEQSFLRYDNYLAAAAAKEKKGCVAALPSGLYWDRHDLDWMGSSMSPEDIQKIAVEKKTTACLE